MTNVRSASHARAGLTRRAAIGLGVAALSTLPAGMRHVGRARADEAADGPELRMAIEVDPDGLDPQRTTAASTFQVTSNIYDTLLEVNASGEVQPGLAESWEVSDDGLTITFKLRENVSFSNGNPCDAAAVIASFDRLKADDSPRAADYAGITLEAPDATTVVARTGELNVAALTGFAYPWAAIVDVTVADTLRNQPVGTGAYVLREWLPQQSLALQANPSFWGEAPHVPAVSLRVLPDATSRVTSMRAGEIDMALLSADQVVTFEGDSNFTLVQQPQNGVQLMAMNLANEALADARVRQAINHAVDKQLLIDTVWWGYGERIGSHYPTVLPEYVDTNDRYPYDPDAARQLLADAGHAQGLTLRMRLPESYPSYVDAGQLIADSLSQVGITCDIEIVEWATWLEDVYTARNYDLTVVGHTGRLDPYVLLARYDSSSAENYFNYSNPEVDDLLSSYLGERDADRRTELVRDIQEILAEDVPALYIQDPLMTFVTTPAVSGFTVYPIDIYRFRDVTLSA